MFPSKIKPNDIRILVDERTAGVARGYGAIKLAGSIKVTAAKIEGTSIVAGVHGGDGPAFYGSLFEYGESGGPSVILPVNARALAFVTHGQQVFAASVKRSPIAARPFMAPSLAENADRIQSELQDALNQELNKE